MEYTFKQEFEDKLNQLGVKEQFIANIVQEEGEETAVESFNKLNEKETFEEFIMAAFIWGKSTEGIDFWENISKQ